MLILFLNSSFGLSLLCDFYAKTIYLKIPIRDHLSFLTLTTFPSNIDGVLNKLKSKIGSSEEDLPHSSYIVADDLQPHLPDRPFMLKLRKGSNLHRFKIKMVSVVC